MHIDSMGIFFMFVLFIIGFLSIFPLSITAMIINFTSKKDNLSELMLWSLILSCVSGTCEVYVGFNLKHLLDKITESIGVSNTIEDLLIPVIFFILGFFVQIVLSKKPNEKLET